MNTPPYPADTLAKGWRFELDMEKFKRSDTWKLAKTGTVRAALLLLWAEAWQESPCGTLPNDDELIALTIDMPLVTFQKHRGVLMRGWSLASDGRLYHETITTRVLAMLEKRASDAARAAKRRAALADKQAGSAEVTGASRVTHADNHGDSGVSSTPSTKHQAQEPVEEKPPKSPRKRRGAAAEQQLVSLGDLVTEGVSQQHATDWLLVRKGKNLPLTPTAWDGVKDQAKAAGLTLDEAVRIAAVNGWGGFNAKWVPGGQQAGGRVVSMPNRQEAIEARNHAVGDEWLRQQGDAK